MASLDKQSESFKKFLHVGLSREHMQQKDRAIYLAVVLRYQARLISHLPYYRLKGFIIMTLKDKLAREQYSRIYF